MASIFSVQAALVEDYQALPGWEERYQKIIALGRAMPPMPDALKTDDRKVRGCSSTVWLHADRVDGRVVYQADSDAAIPKGLAALLVQVYSGRTPAEILAAPPAFIEELGLDQNLSPNRANGLTSMVRQLMASAAALKDG